MDLVSAVHNKEVELTSLFIEIYVARWKMVSLASFQRTQELFSMVIQFEQITYCININNSWHCEVLINFITPLKFKIWANDDGY